MYRMRIWRKRWQKPESLLHMVVRQAFIMPLQMGKTPVVVPRQAEYGEHVNNHQVEFVENVSKRMGTIIPVYDIADLRNAVCNYDTIISTMTQGAKSHNEEFNREFEKIVDNLFQ